MNGTKISFQKVMADYSSMTCPSPYKLRCFQEINHHSKKNGRGMLSHNVQFFVKI